MATLQKRVLIVDDHKRIHRYAVYAFRDFQRWHALSPSQARNITARQQKEHDAKKPFDLLSCDINMSEKGRYGPVGIGFMIRFHKAFPDIPIICHSDDAFNVRAVSFVRFVMKTNFISEDFNVNEALLRAAALDLVFGEQDFGEQIKRAQALGARTDIDDLAIPAILRGYIKSLKGTAHILDVLALARSGYIDDATLTEFIRYLDSAT